MELTIEQAMQQGVAAHKEGRFQEAERLYQAILQSQPLHPDANHNLGVLEVSFNKADAALPLFKTALEANPKIEQFWLSYIDALIKEKQFDNARQVIEQGKNHGLTGDKVDALNEHLAPITQAPKSTLPEQNKSLTLSKKRKKLAEQKKQKKAKKQNLKTISPSEAEIDNLLQHYQNGEFSDAEKLALSITQEFPKHHFAWTVLAAALTELGRISESLPFFQKSVQLAPRNALAHYNLGTTLAKLGKLEEAAVSYTKASLFQPENPEFYALRGLTPSQIAKQSLTSRSNVMKCINQGDWENSENILRQIFAENPGHIVEHVAEFINLWCIFCRNLINQNAFKKLVPIFINLFIIGERNNDVNELIKQLFERFDIEKILQFVKPEHKILVYLSYCQYNFLNKNFLLAESIAIDNIQKAERLIKVSETEDLGWLVVRRSLALSRRKDVSKTALTNLISNLVN